MESGDYIGLFPGSTREKQRFMAMAEAVVRQVTDLQTVVGEINGAFAPERAQGEQLDVLGASLGLSRGETNAGVTATDEVFRDFVLKKLVRWGWDGRNVTVKEVLGKIQEGAVITDHQDGTVTISGAGSQPAPVKDLFPITAGIRTT